MHTLLLRAPAADHEREGSSGSAACSARVTWRNSRTAQAVHMVKVVEEEVAVKGVMEDEVEEEMVVVAAGGRSTCTAADRCINGCSAGAFHLQRA